MVTLSSNHLLLSFLSCWFVMTYCCPNMSRLCQLRRRSFANSQPNWSRPIQPCPPNICKAHAMASSRAASALGFLQAFLISFGVVDGVLLCVLVVAVVSSQTIALVATAIPPP